MCQTLFQELPMQEGISVLTTALWSVHYCDPSLQMEKLRHKAVKRLSHDLRTV